MGGVEATWEWMGREARVNMDLEWTEGRKER